MAGAAAGAGLGGRRLLILQSLRPVAPAWARTCVASVRRWAAAHGHGYRLIGDALFDPLPEGFRAAHGLLPATDLARLLWLRRLIGEGHGLVAWLDADVLVTDPAGFALPGRSALCRELWLWREDDGGIHGRLWRNNAAMTFAAGEPLLDAYIAAVEARIAEGPLDRLALGPRLLGRLDEGPTIDTIATLSPTLMGSLLRGEAEMAAAHRKHWPAPVHAVHLCASLSPGGGSPTMVPAGAAAAMVERLTGPGGGALAASLGGGERR